MTDAEPEDIPVVLGLMRYIRETRDEESGRTENSGLVREIDRAYPKSSQQRLVGLFYL